MLENITQILETIRSKRHQMTALQLHEYIRAIRQYCEEMTSYSSDKIEILINPKTTRNLKYGKTIFSRWEVFPVITANLQAVLPR